MAFRYGGNMRTRSTEPSPNGRLRASSSCMCAGNPESSSSPLTMQPLTTRSAVSRNLGNSFEGARWKTLCSRLWDRSAACEAPDRLLRLDSKLAFRYEIDVISKPLTRGFAYCGSRLRYLQAKSSLCRLFGRNFVTILYFYGVFGLICSRTLSQQYTCCLP